MNRLNTESPPRPVDIDKIPETSHPTKTTKLINKFVIAGLVAIGVSLSIIMSWALEPTNALVVNNSPFPTRSVRANAEQNGVIILTVDFCKNTNKQGEIRASFVSYSREVFLPLTKERLGKGCAKTEMPVLIPKDLPADDYKLKFTVRYNLNPLKQNIPIVFESRTFHVDSAGQQQSVE